MATIPFFNRQVAPQTQSMPRGSMQAAGAVWDAVAGAGQQIANLGEKGMNLAAQIQEKKENLKNSTLAMQYDASFKQRDAEIETFTLQNEKSGIETTPDMLRPIYDKYNNLASGYLNQMTGEYKNKSQVDFEHKKKIGEASIQQFGIKQEIKQNQVLWNKSKLKLIEAGDFNTVRENINNATWMTPKEKEIELIDLQLKESAFIDNMTSINVNELASNGDTEAAKKELEKIKNPVVRRKTEVELGKIERTVYKNDQSILADNEYANGNIDNGNAIIDKLQEDKYLSSVEAQKARSNGILSAYKLEAIDTPEQLQMAVQTHEQFKTKHSASTNAQIQKLFDSQMLRLRTSQMQSIALAVQSSDTATLNNLRNDAKILFGEREGNALIDDAIYTADAQNPDVQKTSKVLKAENPMWVDEYNGFVSEIKAINGRVYSDDVFGAQYTAGISKPSESSINDVKVLGSRIAESKMPFAMKQYLLNENGKKLLPSGVLRAKTVLDTAHESTSTAVEASGNARLWNRFYDTAQEYDRLMKANDKDGAKELLIKFDSDMKSEAASAITKGSVFKSAPAIRSALQSGIIGRSEPSVANAKELADAEEWVKNNPNDSLAPAVKARIEELKKLGTK